MGDNEGIDGAKSQSVEDLNEETSDWKSKLSGTLNEEEIFFSLLVLGIFHAIYTIGKAYFDANDTSDNDEDRFIQSCYCGFSQRFFYRFLFSLCCLTWFLIHSYTFLAQVLTKKFPKFGKIIKTLFACCIVFSKFIVCSCFNCMCNKTKSVYSISNHNYLKGHNHLASRVQSNLRLLWFQYCKLYVVGYTKYEDKLSKINVTEEEQTDYNNEQEEASCCSCCSCCSLKCSKPSQSQEGDCVCCRKHITCPDINIKCCNEYFPKTHMLKGIIRGLLFLVKYISQLVTVPLLFLQIFDTYSLLCFSPDPYCSNTTEYKLHLAQAAITMLFYCSLALSQLASTMLIWNPWPKTDETIKKN